MSSYLRTGLLTITGGLSLTISTYCAVPSNWERIRRKPVILKYRIIKENLKSTHYLPPYR